MGIFPNHRFTRPGFTQDDAASSSGASATHNSNNKCFSLLPLVVALVVIGEIAFLLDLSSNAGLVISFYHSTMSSLSHQMVVVDDESGLSMFGGVHGSSDYDSCVKWLEEEDSVTYARDFKKDPVLISGFDQGSKSCAVGCNFGVDSNMKSDAGFGLHKKVGTSSVLLSMESSQYYTENNIASARRKGYRIVMTTSLSSDVPVGYFSWAEYDIMAPVKPKTESAIAAAFISNCAAHNFRLQALEALEKANVKIGSYGSCHRNRDGRVDKVETLKGYKFSLAFENSNEEDYVTEKFFQSLVAGAVPVVVGAPNIQEFSPSPGSVLHIRRLDDVDAIAKTMKYLAENPDAYNQSLKWKFEGPSDSFKALIDMAAVHSSCRLCIHIATMIQEDEEKKPDFRKRPCNCTKGSETVYHIYTRERGRFEMESIFLRSGNMTLEALETAVLLKFKSLKHVPIWKQERPESIRGDELKVYRIYPLGMTQRQALYTFKFQGDSEFKSHVESNPCAKFEVIFV